MDDAFIGLENKTLFVILSGCSLKDFVNDIVFFKTKDAVWVGITERSFYQKNNIPITHIINYCHCADKLFIPNCEYKVFRKTQARGNSLQEFLYQCTEAKIKRIFIFGGDGYGTEEQPYYDGYPSCDSAFVNVSAHIRDTEHFNKTFDKELTKDIEIYNVSPDSKYTILNNITYDECKKLLS